MSSALVGIIELAFGEGSHKHQGGSKSLKVRRPVPLVTTTIPTPTTNTGPSNFNPS